jgi:tetratricopeptide (TPR) repeat protein
VTLESLGALDAAEEAFGEALAGRTRLLGAGDPAVIETLNNLAFVHEGRGDVEGALALFHDALRAAEAAPDMPRMTLLGLANNVGATYQDLGRDAEAAPHLRRASGLAGELLGPDHPSTLTIRSNLAGLEVELGDPARAAEIYAEVAAASARALGPGAEDTFVARYGQWDAVGRAGRKAEACAGFDELLADAARELGQRHWLVPNIQSALARALADCGAAEDGLPLAVDAEERLRALLGADHPRARSAQGIVTFLEAALAAK